MDRARSGRIGSSQARIGLKGPFSFPPFGPRFGPRTSVCERSDISHSSQAGTSFGLTPFTGVLLAREGSRERSRVFHASWAWKAAVREWPHGYSVQWAHGCPLPGQGFHRFNGQGLSLFANLRRPKPISLSPGHDYQENKAANQAANQAANVSPGDQKGEANYQSKLHQCE